MRRVLTRIVVCLSVVTFATPATIASAAGADEAASPVVAASPAVTAAQPAAATSLRQATERAAAATASQRAGQPAPQPGQRGTGARYQMGGGKGAMVMGLVYTVVGLGASIYMIKMMQDRNKDDEQQ